MGHSELLDPWLFSDTELSTPPKKSLISGRSDVVRDVRDLFRIAAAKLLSISSNDGEHSCVMENKPTNT